MTCFDEVYSILENQGDASYLGEPVSAGHFWAAQWFGPEVTEPIRFHVAAKWYMCCIDPEY